MADHSAILNPSKPAAQMFTLTQLTDGSVGILFQASRAVCVLIFCSVIPVIHPETSVCL